MLGTQKSKGPKRNAKTSHHFNIIKKKLDGKAMIKTNSPYETVLTAFSVGKKHPLYIRVTFIYSLLLLVSILLEIL